MSRNSLWGAAKKAIRLMVFAVLPIVLACCDSGGSSNSADSGMPEELMVNWYRLAPDSEGLKTLESADTWTFLRKTATHYGDTFPVEIYERGSDYVVLKQILSENTKRLIDRLIRIDFVGKYRISVDGKLYENGFVSRGISEEEMNRRIQRMITSDLKLLCSNATDEVQKQAIEDAIKLTSRGIQTEIDYADRQFQLTGNDEWRIRSTTLKNALPTLKKLEPGREDLKDVLKER